MALCDNCLRKQPLGAFWPFTSPQPKSVSNTSSLGQGFQREQRMVGRELWLQEKRKESYRLEEYVKGLEQLAGLCVLCVITHESVENGRSHKLERCGSRFSFFDSKKAVIKATRKVDGSPDWFSRFSCCFTCFQPQEICCKEEGTVCGGVYRDILLPACWQAWRKINWVEKHLPKLSGKEDFHSEVEFFKWMGIERDFYGIKGHNGCIVLEDIMRRFL